MSGITRPAIGVWAAASPPVARLPKLRLAAAMPGMVEFVALALAIAVLLPAFDAADLWGVGRGERFLDHGVEVSGLPEPALDDTCRAVGAVAEPSLRDALCAWPRLSASTRTSVAAWPAPLSLKVGRANEAFVDPLRAFEREREALVGETAEGSSAASDKGDALVALETERERYVARYGLTRGALGGPTPLRCATAWVDDMLRAGASLPADAGTVRQQGADALLLLAAALDGRPSAAVVAADARLPARSDVPAPTATACAGIVESLSATSALMADARQSVTRARKNAAMRDLAVQAGVQWATAMALGYAFVLWSRRTTRPALGAGVALVAWSVAAWAARVPWPFAGPHGFEPARPDAGWAGSPALFVILPALFGVALAAVSLWRRPLASSPHAADAPQTMSSRIGYAGFAVATGVGTLLLLDLSFDGHPVNRYLALYHQGHLWLAMALLSVLVFARRGLAGVLAWGLSLATELYARVGRTSGPAGAAALLVGAAAVCVLAIGFALANVRQLTSELGRVWLIGGAAWFFFLRAGPMTERLARSGSAGRSFLRFGWPMLFVVGVLVAAMFTTRDMGPLLIAGYASGAFVAAAAAMWWHHRSGRVAAAFAVAAGLFAVWIAAVTVALFHAGAYDGVTASRLESVAAPFASVNDQLALVSWFQQAAPASGFGLGTTPWCGFSVERCSGVPAQIHSDYTFTAMVGVFGPLVAWALSLGATVWLHRLIRHHGRITRGEPRLRRQGGRLVLDAQALVSWIALGWVVLASCQLVVTVAGNLAVLPLTGVTFPFVSFGMTSLLVNTAFLALCLNVDMPDRSGRA